MFLPSVTGCTNAEGARSRKYCLHVCYAFALQTMVLSNAYGQQDKASFDADTLRARGIDPSIVRQFERVSKFLPGLSMVSVSVNGQQIGTTRALFDQSGQLCLNETFLRFAGLQIPRNMASSSACQNVFLSQWPTASVHADPEKLAVELVVPPLAVLEKKQEQRTYQTGGTAAVFNYDVLATRSQYSGGANDFFQSSTEIGLNFRDWSFRSDDVFSSQNGQQQWSHLYAYAQRALVPFRSALQAGQITAQGSIFGGFPLNGVQISPEQSLTRLTTGDRSPIQGMARTQARVDIRQGGALLYSTVVPPGAFTIPDVRLLSRNQDLTVTVNEADGTEHSFVIPAASLQRASLGAADGLSVTLGKVRNINGAYAETPWVVNLNYGWVLNRQVNLTMAGILSTSFRSMGARVDMSPWRGGFLSGQIQHSNDHRARTNGSQFTLTVSTRLAFDFSTNLSATRRTAGYRDLLDTVSTGYSPEDGSSATDPTSGQTRRQRSAGLSWSNAKVGSLSMTYADSDTFSGWTSRRLLASWSRQFGKATMSLTVERDVGSSTSTGNSAYLMASFPLGRNRVSAYGSRNDGRDRVGVSTNATIGDYGSYSLSTEMTGSGDQSANGSISLTPRYTQLNLGISRYSDGTGYSGAIRGGIVMHGDGVTFSPYKVRDTFGIAKVGDLSGVKLATPAGAVWTDAWGRAVVPSLPPYETGRVQVQTASLARNVDLINGYAEVAAGYASVNSLDFGVVAVRRVLLTARYADGTPLPKSAVVVNEKGDFVTLVGNDGMIFVPDVASDNGPLTVEKGRERCVLNFSLPKKADRNVVYERAPATCIAAPAR